MAPIGAAKFDRQMRFVDTNQRFVDGLRLGSQPLVGRSLYHVLPEIPLHWREAHKCCLNGKVRRLEREAFLRADGSIDWTEGQLLYRVATIVDRRDDLQRTPTDDYAAAITHAETGIPPFPDTLAQLVGDHAEAAGLEFELDLPEVIGHVPPAVLRTLLDVAREALLNTVRNARATRVAVVLCVDKALITLRIWDDGIGIRDDDRLKPDCSGLSAAAERLASVSSALQVCSTPGKGSTFEATAPLSPAHRPMK